MKTTSVLIILTVLMGMTPSAWALTDIELTGELNLAAQVYNLPTGSRGDSAFVVPAFQLGLTVPLKQSNALVATLEGAEKREGATREFDVYARNVYLDVVSLFDGLHSLRLGLIPQTWQEAQYEDWNYRFLGSSGKVMTEKYRYLSYSDLGASFTSSLPQELGEWAVTVSNGEGAEKAETGPHKEFGIFLRFAKAAPWTFALAYVRGAYDGIDDSFSLKERVQALAMYQSDDQWMVGLELLDTHDPAEAVRDLKMADEVDTSPWLGQSIHGVGGSLFAEISTGPLAKVLMRYDYLQPTVGLSDKELKSALLGLSYQVTEDIRSALMVDYTQYTEGYGLGVRDASKIAFATQVLF